MSNFVTYTKQEFEDDILGAIGPTWELVSGNEDQTCWEYVYEFQTDTADVGVRIFSTVDKRSGRTRGKGEDAIRVVFWDTRNDRPVGKGKKILRVEKATSIAQRISERVNSFFNDASSVEITDFDYVRHILEDNAQNNSFASRLLDSFEVYGSLTENQLAYVLGTVSPKGWDTLEAKSKKKNPSFTADWMACNTENGDEAAEITPTSAPKGRRLRHYPEGDGRTYMPGLVCEVCGAPIYNTNSGRVCDNGHGGIEGIPADLHMREDPGNVNGTVEVNGVGGVEGVGDYEEPPHNHTATTDLYRHWEYPFTHFNPVQSTVLMHRDSPNNLIIGANTSAGKTICAELLMDHVLGQETHNRVIYLSPLKSLTQEKYDDWQKRYPDVEITILTGDYTLSEAMKNKLTRSGIIVMTSEMADSRTRRMESERNYWLKEVGLVIVDESHILATDRGHAVESGLMRFTRINRDARVLFLSATMPNCKELAQWVTTLNGKRTDVVFSTWRPVELQLNFVGHPILTNGGGRTDYWGTQNAKQTLAVELVQAKPDEKFLVFCHDKNTGRNMVKRFEKLGVDAHFHNADLDMDQRLDIERSFANRQGGLRVLVSTSTLAWGRNLPARNVVIIGVHRGIQEVDELDIIQMAGRAGRYGIDDAGFVSLICPQGTETRWAETFKNPRPVTSVINDPDVLAFHILAEIENRYIDSVDSLFKWYKRSLAYLQDAKPFELEDAQGLLDDLKNMEMVSYKGNYVRPNITDLGKVSAWLYFSPYDIYDWYINFGKLYGPEAIAKPDDLTLAWALGDIKSNDWGYIPGDMRNEAENWKYDLRNRGLHASDAVAACIAAHHCLTGTKVKGTGAALMRGIIYDIRRMAQALTLIDKMYAQWDIKPVWDTLPQRITYGISEEMVELTLVPGIGGVTARKLYEKGITNLYELANRENFRKLVLIVSPAKAKAFQEEAAKLL